MQLSMIALLCHARRPSGALTALRAVRRLRPRDGRGPGAPPPRRRRRVAWRAGSACVCSVLRSSAPHRWWPAGRGSRRLTGSAGRRRRSRRCCESWASETWCCAAARRVSRSASPPHAACRAQRGGDSGLPHRRLFLASPPVHSQPACPMPARLFYAGRPVPCRPSRSQQGRQGTFSAALPAGKEGGGCEGPTRKARGDVMVWDGAAAAGQLSEGLRAGDNSTTPARPAPAPDAAGGGAVQAQVRPAPPREDTDTGRNRGSEHC